MGQTSATFRGARQERVRLSELVTQLENQSKERQMEEMREEHPNTISGLRREREIEMQREIDGLNRQLSEKNQQFANLKKQLKIIQVEFEKQFTISKSIQSEANELVQGVKKLGRQDLQMELNITCQEADRANLDETLSDKEHTVTKLQSVLDTERADMQMQLDKLKEQLKVKDTEKANVNDEELGENKHNP